MITFLAICYAGLIWVVFFKLKLLRWDRKSQVLAVTVGVAAIFALVVLMNLYQPQAVSATVSQRVVPIVARVSGRIIDVPVEPNTPLSEGDVLFRIDPRPYQAEVDRLEAALAAAEQNVPQLEAAWDQAVAARTRAVAQRDLAQIDFDRTEEAFRRQAASQIEHDAAGAHLAAAKAGVQEAEASEQRAKLAYRSEIGGVNTAVAEITAMLDKARIDLDECTVYAPADGEVTQLFVAPGAVTLTMPFTSVMSFVYAGDCMVRANFRPNAMRFVREGDFAEVVFAAVPGQVFNAKVHSISPATGEGAMSPTGDLQTTRQLAGSDLLLVRLELDDERLTQQVPAGTACAVAAYAEGAKPIRIVRKVILRIQAWINYL